MAAAALSVARLRRCRSARRAAIAAVVLCIALLPGRLLLRSPADLLSIEQFERCFCVALLGPESLRLFLG